MRDMHPGVEYCSVLMFHICTVLHPHASQDSLSTPAAITLLRCQSLSLSRLDDNMPQDERIVTGSAGGMTVVRMLSSHSCRLMTATFIL